MAARKRVARGDRDLRALIGGALAIAAVVGGGCGGGDALPPVSRDAFGVNAQGVRELSTLGDDDAVERHLSGISRLGVDFVRANTDWESLEPRPPTAAGPVYDFTTHDQWVTQLARHGLRWQVTGIGVATPEWARAAASAGTCAERSPPEPGAFASLMGALAERYGRRGSFWREHPELNRLPVTDYEIWNEPNYGVFWCPAPNPAVYGATALATARAIHGADPAARVVLGGLAGFNEVDASAANALSAERFVAETFAAEPALAESIDRVGLHIYAGTPDEIIDRLEEVRSALDAQGVRLPIALSEFGWPTQGAGSIDEEQRASYLGDVPRLVLEAGCDVVAIAAHTWISPELDSGNPDHWFGLADPATGAPKSSASAYGEAVSELAPAA